MTAKNAKRLMEHVDEFALCMKARLMEDDEILQGWDNKDNLQQMHERLITTITANLDGRAVDVAIFAMFLWCHIPDELDLQITKIKNMMNEFETKNRSTS